MPCYDDNTKTSSRETNRCLANEIIDAADATSLWQNGSDELDRVAQRLADESGEVVYWGTTAFLPASH